MRAKTSYSNEQNCDNDHCPHPSADYAQWLFYTLSSADLNRISKGMSSKSAKSRSSPPPREKVFIDAGRGVDSKLSLLKVSTEDIPLLVLVVAVVVAEVIGPTFVFFPARR